MKGHTGSRLPALFANDNGDQVELYFSTDLNSNNDYYFKYIVDKFSWINVEMSETYSQYVIKVNDQVVHSKRNDAPSEWESVDVDIARRIKKESGEYSPSSGKYRNFVYDLCPKIEKGIS